MESHSIQGIDKLVWQVYIEVRPLIWLDVRDLWLGRAVIPEYVKGLFSVGYENESYKYNKAGCVDNRVIEKAKDLIYWARRRINISINFCFAW